jgi:hypothetical protein
MNRTLKDDPALLAGWNAVKRVRNVGTRTTTAVTPLSTAVPTPAPTAAPVPSAAAA